MTAKIYLAATIAIVGLCLSFRAPKNIDRCYFSTKSLNGLVPREPDRLPEASRTARQLETAAGEVSVSRIDGYRILYNNPKGAPFVNVKVELSDDGSYADDTAKIVAHFRYLASRSKLMESPTLMTLQYNGYQIYGYSRADIDSGTYLGTFVFFPGNDVTVHIYFQNLKPAYRNFESLEDYKAQRNAFLGEYTSWLNSCRK